MDAEILIAAVGKQLDALSSLISWAIGLALVTAWAGLQREQEISLLSMRIARKDALYLLGAAFLFVNISAILYFLRIADLIILIPSNCFHKALTLMGTHPWPFNPYAYFGNSNSAMLVSNFGYGGLITIWWIGYTALALVQDDKKNVAFSVVVGIFLLVGLASMSAIQYVFMVILSRTGELDDELRRAIRSHTVPRTIFTFLGICLGSVIFWVAQKLQTKRGTDELSELNSGNRA